MFGFFEVGGAVRDAMLGITSKDVDFSVVANGFATMDAAFAAFLVHIAAEGFQVFEVKPEFQTVRAKVPMGHPLADRTAVADFVLARKDGPSSDGRRPDFVEPGTLFDDLARRDFTVNAMALTPGGALFDPFDGSKDLAAGVLRFVGDPMARISEDGLRVARAFRFMVTKGLRPTPSTMAALQSPRAAAMLGGVAVERVQVEVDKMFHHDTLATLSLMADLPDHTRKAIFRDGLRLAATMKA